MIRCIDEEFATCTITQDNICCFMCNKLFTCKHRCDKIEDFTNVVNCNSSIETNN